MAPTASPTCYLLDDADHVVDAVFPRKGTLAQAIRGAVAKHLLHEQLTGASRPSCCTDDLCTGMMAQVGEFNLLVCDTRCNAAAGVEVWRYVKQEKQHNRESIQW
jgi:hypothetical protein